MKIKLLLLFALITVTGAAQQQKPPPKEKHPSTNQRFTQIPSHLRLSKPQSKAFKEIVSKYRQQRHHQNREMIKQLKTILTPEQFEKLKKIVRDDSK